MSEPAKICAVVVTFRPDLKQLSDVLHAVAPQTQEMLVVDNSPDAQDSAAIQSLVSCTCAKFLALGRNFGVALAQNRGVAWASANDCTHVLLLDQDSVPAPDMVSQLLAAEKKLLDSGIPVAAVGPQYVDPRSGQRSAFIRIGGYRFQRVSCARGNLSLGKTILADFLISSGSLIQLEVLRKVGPLDESLFIDRVDTDWYLRARRAGLLAFGVCAAQMTHRLGDRLVKLWAGGWRHYPIHDTTRLYYIFRNSCLLYRRGHAPLDWVIKDATRLTVMFVFYSLVAQPRLKRLKMMAKGLLHGITGRSGMLP